MDDSEEDTPGPVARPEKNINVFICDENIGVFPDKIFDGEMGPLPLLICVNVGYDPEECDPYMHYYESLEVMFAYKKGAQKRVLMRDSHGRTLSLPLHSNLPFRLGTDTKEMTMADLVSSHGLPVSLVKFAHAECMYFTVDRNVADHSFFGSFTVTAVYDEPYLWCLAVEPNGRTGDKPIVLPRNLLDAGFCPVVGIRGARDPSAKVKEFLDSYSEVAHKLQFEGDPFFQELAFVSHGPEPVTKIEPYIDQNTFIPIRIERKTPPSAPSGRPPPPPPPRNPLRSLSSAEEQTTSPHYGSVSGRDSEEHLYTMPMGRGDVKPKTHMVTPFQQIHAESPPLPDETGLGRPLMMKPPSDEREPPPRDPREPPPLPDRKDLSGDPQKSHAFNVELMTPPKRPPRAVMSHLNSLSVEDVARKLKELGLEKYAKKFRKNRIDGVLLQKISEEHLKVEFKMTQMEFLVLDTFITEAGRE